MGICRGCYSEPEGAEVFELDELWWCVRCMYENSSCALDEVDDLVSTLNIVCEDDLCVKHSVFRAALLGSKTGLLAAENEGVLTVRKTLKSTVQVLATIRASFAEDVL